MTQPHDVLGVRPGASHDDVVAAYRAAAKRSHPDAGGSPEEFRQVREAYLALTDPCRRQHIEAEERLRSRSESLPACCITPAMQRVGATVTVPIPLWGDCSDCGGTGRRKRRSGRSCRDCEGSGNHEEFHRGKSWVMPCRDCAGTGVSSERCWSCSGQGRQLIALEQRIRLAPGSKEGVYRLDGKPAFRLKVIPIG